MKCPNCGNEIPSQSKFCLSCGKPVEGTRPVAPVQQPGNKGLKIGAIAAGLILVAVAAAAIYLIRGRGVTQATPVPNPNQSPVVNAPNVPNGPQANVLQTDVKKPPLDANNPEKPKAPPEVVAYLDHLKKVEERRMALKTQEEGALLSIIPHLQVDPLKQMLDWTDNPDSNKEPGKDTEDKAKQMMDQLSRDWQQLAQFFQSVQAPDQCATLAAKYYDALRDVISTTNDVRSVLVNGDLDKAYAMRGKSGRIDDKLTAADQELGNVCGRFGLEKSFSIRSDTGMQPIMGLPTGM